jgi:hypothetical protein
MEKPNELESREKVIATIRSCKNNQHLNSTARMIGNYFKLFPQNRGVHNRLNKMLDRQQKVFKLKKINQ